MAKSLLESLLKDCNALHEDEFNLTAGDKIEVTDDSQADEVIEPVIDTDLEDGSTPSSYVNKNVIFCNICLKPFFSDEDVQEDTVCPTCSASAEDLVLVGKVVKPETTNNEEGENVPDDNTDASNVANESFGIGLPESNINSSNNCYKMNVDMTGMWASPTLLNYMDFLTADEIEEAKNKMRAHSQKADKYEVYASILRDLFLKHGYKCISYTDEKDGSGQTRYINVDKLSESKKVNEDVTVTVNTDASNVNVDTSDANVSVNAGSNTEVPAEPVTEPEEDEEPALSNFEYEEESFNKIFTKFLTDNYSNVKAFNLIEAKMSNNVLTLEGVITYNEGSTRNVTIKTDEMNLSEGVSKVKAACPLFGKSKAFVLEHKVDNNKLEATKMLYRYKTRFNNESYNVVGKVVLE